jgi:hypothetical protein
MPHTSDAPAGASICFFSLSSLHMPKTSVLTHTCDTDFVGGPDRYFLPEPVAKLTKRMPHTSDAPAGAILNIQGRRNKSNQNKERAKKSQMQIRTPNLQLHTSGVIPLD